MFHSSKFHLDQVDESYPEHFRAALGISLRLAAASAACALHAIVPGVCTRTASRGIARVHAHLTSRGGTPQHRDASEFENHRPRHVHLGDA